MKRNLKKWVAFLMVFVVTLAFLRIDIVVSEVLPGSNLEDIDVEMTMSAQEFEEQEESLEENLEEKIAVEQEEELLEETADMVVIVEFNPYPYAAPEDPDTNYIVVKQGTLINDIMLPAAIKATAQGGETDALMINVLSWDCIGIVDELDKLEEGGYIPEMPGVYRFAPILDLADNYSLAEGLAPPAVDVVVTADIGIGIMPLMAAPDLETQIRALGLTVAISPTDSKVINVTGTITNRQAAFNLNIDSDVTVNWGAKFSGSLNSAYILNLTGAGTFNLTSNGLISNTGTGGAVNITGSGTIMNMYGGALSSGLNGVSSASNSVTLNIATSNVTVNITGNGSIINAGTSSAVSVTSNVTGVKINIDGSKVTSTPSGYAINDGGTATTTPYTNDTKINITGGSVIEAGNACAIQSTGGASVVTVTDSTLRNAAATNTNSTIYMNGGTGDNVIINGASIVQTTNSANTSYVIQTTGNVRVEDRAQVVAIAGRAINLVGMNSVATIKDNAVVSAESGIAISTATTTVSSVANAKVVVAGGWVYTKSGTAAIQTTGTNGTVDITGGWVTATTGLAVKASAATDIRGGLVFAYGTGVGSVVTAVPAFANPAANGVVVAWNNASTNHTYVEGTNNDLSIFPSPVPPNPDVYWHKSGVTGGIYYKNNANEGFFPLAEVIVELVTLQTQGLFFNIGMGKFYLDALSLTEYLDQAANWHWDSITNTLTLTDFTWATNYSDALTIINGGEIIINLVGANTFVSNAPPNLANPSVITNSGLKSTAANITVKGAGTLNATASAGRGINGEGRSFTIESGTVNAAAGNGANTHGMEVGHLIIKGGVLNSSSGGPATTGAYYGINAQNLTVHEGSGVIMASGNSRAVNSAVLNLPGGYAYWKGSRPDGSNANTMYAVPGDTLYSYNASNSYVKIQARERHTLIVTNGTDITNLGPYFAGQLVTISSTISYLPGPDTSGLPPDATREVFKAWTGGDGGICSDVNSPTASFKMPDNNATVVATTQTAYLLTIAGGYLLWNTSISPNRGYYTVGAEVPIRSFGMTYGGAIFVNWKVESGGSQTLLKDPNAGYTIFTMPGNSASISVDYLVASVFPATFNNLTVEYGTGNGTRGTIVSKPGAIINLVADQASPGKEFDRWEIVSYVANESPYQGAIYNPASRTTTFTMGDGDIKVTATYRDIDFALIVENGAGSGSYKYNESITITADPLPEEEYRFIGWTVSGGSSSLLTNPNSLTTTFIMPDSNLTVTANFQPIFKLTVIGGTIVSTGLSEGYYPAGAEITILGFDHERDPYNEDMIFSRWIGAFINENGDSVSFININSKEITFIMPDGAASVRANFRELNPSNQTLYTLTVINGTARNLGPYLMGTKVSIEADPPPLTQTFNSWTITGSARGSFDNAASSNTFFTMPAKDTIITANYTTISSPGGGDQQSGDSSTEKPVTKPDVNPPLKPPVDLPQTPPVDPPPKPTVDPPLNSSIDPTVNKPGGTDPDKQPIPNPGGRLEPGIDGKYIEIGEDGTPKGCWYWDDDLFQWVFEKCPTMVGLPNSGITRQPTDLVFLLCLSLFGINIVRQRWVIKRGMHKP